jgi:hypothetical protein
MKHGGYPPFVPILPVTVLVHRRSNVHQFGDRLSVVILPDGLDVFSETSLNEGLRLIAIQTSLPRVSYVAAAIRLGSDQAVCSGSVADLISIAIKQLPEEPYKSWLAQH